VRFFPILALFLCVPALAFATPGMRGFEQTKQCVMQNDSGYCHRIVTPSSYPWLEKFQNYKLMPCLPTDLTYDSEKTGGGITTVVTTVPVSSSQQSILRLLFVDTPSGPLLDLPRTFARGFGNNWQNKLQMAEQIYLMMRQNLGTNPSCEMLTGLLKK
jgi:hypothetical protein